MPLPIAHGLVGAAVVVALSKPSQPFNWKLVLIGALLGMSPDFDYALNWLRISGGGWHHGFTHSLLFAFILGIVTAIALGERTVRGIAVLVAATASHTLLDFMMTESRGVALWWPFTNQRYKLRLPNPIDYTWNDTSFWAAAPDVLKICATELIIFGPILLIVLGLKRFLVSRRYAPGRVN